MRNPHPRPHLVIGSAIVSFLLLGFAPNSAGGQDAPLRLVQDPSLSPDGKKMVFAYGGDLWTVPTRGGRARALTTHPATDRRPLFSRDGESIAFISNRDGQNAVYRMTAKGGTPKQTTFHSEGYALQDWFPGNEDVLTTGSRDHFWRKPERLIRVSTSERQKEEVLADAYASDASVSGDGKRVLFVREGERWWRKGYYGPRSAQIWMLDLETGGFRLVISETYDCRWPRWIGNEDAFVFTRGHSHGFELCRFDFDDESPSVPVGDEIQPESALTAFEGKITALTDFKAESVVYPSVSADGSTVVFRHLFDVYTMPLDFEDEPPAPKKVRILPPIDSARDDEIRRSISRADDTAFTEDGLEIAFIAGGDLWVMDTKLREPKRVTQTAGWESSPVFSGDGRHIYLTADVDGQVDIHKVTRGDEDLYWWQNDSFQITAVTDDADVESNLKLSPDGKRLFFVRGLGDLVHTDLDGKGRKLLARSFAAPSYDISSDGRWVAYSLSDDDFNNDVFIVDAKGKRKPYNVSRHPDDDFSPRFSPDGKLLAFTGRRVDEEIDIYYVWLQDDERDKSSRERELEEALALMKKKRGDTDKGDDADDDDDAKAKGAKNSKAGDDEKIVIDFDDLHERLRSIRIPDSSERSLIWDPDGKKLAFSASIDGDRGLYTVTFPDDLRPKKYSSTTGATIAWTKKAGGLLMNVSGTPALVKGNSVERYSFSANQIVDRGQWLQAGFDTAWRTMRDRWYDAKTGGRNWGAVRRKYRDLAAELPGPAALGELIQLMLGELNGSHNGFYPRGTTRYDSGQDWNDRTAHLGVRFDASFQGPGLKVRDVIPGGPADKAGSRLNPGDVIISIDGVEVDIAMDLTRVLNGRLDRDIRLVVLPSESDPDKDADRDEPDEAPEEDDDDSESESDESDDANESKDDPSKEKKDEADKDQAGKDDAEEDSDDGTEEDSDDDAEEDSDDDAKEDSDDDAEELDDPEKVVVIRPVSYALVRSQLYGAWLEYNRKKVDQWSDGKLGYLHIRAMNQ
ncbi:MAG: PDZ domain-containing protein, partial [Planctomycetota bacterium]